MPKYRELPVEHRNRLHNTISMKFGGYEKVSGLLDYPYGSRRFFRSLDQLQESLDPIVQQIGRMPKQSELRAMTRHDLVRAIARFGGPFVVAEALSYEFEGRHYRHSAQDLMSVLAPLAEQLGRMPKQEELRALGHAMIAGAIDKFGGYEKVAADLGFEYKSRRVHDLESLRTELAPLVELLGKFPSKNDLVVRSRFDLDRAITKFGGYPKIAGVFGYPYATVGEQSSERLRGRILSGQAFSSELERQAGQILSPFGFRPHAVRISNHAFDYSDPSTQRAVEINGCYWHDHRAILPTCGTKITAHRRETLRRRDEAIRLMAQKHGWRLLELWECELDQWEEQLFAWLTSTSNEGF